MRSSNIAPTCVVLTFAGLLLIPVDAAACTSTAFTVTPFAPPPAGNWTNTSGSVWSTAGSYPGQLCTGDTASDTNGSPTTLFVASAIPNALGGLTLNCPGCTIDIQSGGQLGLAGTGSAHSSSTIIVEPGGLFMIDSGGAMTFNAGASLSGNGGNIDVLSGGQLSLNGCSSVSGGLLQVDGSVSLGCAFHISSLAGSGSFNLGAFSATVGYLSNSDSTFSGAFSGSGGLTKVGAGVLTLYGNNTATGPLTIDSGTVRLLGSWNGPIVLNGGSVVYATPEPSTLTLFGFGALIVAFGARRRRSSRRR
jgi:fibronectin-binding autotransporter adhesin